MARSVGRTKGLRRFWGQGGGVECGQRGDARLVEVARVPVGDRRGAGGQALEGDGRAGGDDLRPAAGFRGGEGGGEAVRPCAVTCPSVRSSTSTITLSSGISCGPWTTSTTKAATRARRKTPYVTYATCTNGPGTPACPDRRRPGWSDGRGSSIWRTKTSMRSSSITRHPCSIWMSGSRREFRRQAYFQQAADQGFGKSGVTQVRTAGSHYKMRRNKTTVIVPLGRDPLPIGTQRSIMIQAGLIDADL